MSVTNPDKVVTKQDLADFYQELLPYLGGVLPFSGQINRSDIYSTTEKVVGCWRDGRPLYQKTVTCGALPNTSTKQVQHEINNLIRVIEITGYAYRPTDNTTFPLDRAGTSGETAIQLTVNNTYINITTSQDRSNFTESYITLKYTKTTDAANSFNYASENDYSTSEKIVGTWIDGRTIYQKTFQTTMPTTSADGTNVTDTVTWSTIGISAPTFVVDVQGIADKGGSSYRPVNCANSSTRFTSVMAVPTGIGISNSVAAFSGKTAYITIKYTKS